MTTAYGLAWDARRAAYYSVHPARCHRCNKSGRRHRLELHHIYGVGNHWRVGEEPDYALIPLCDPGCHDVIHGRHRRYASKRGWTTADPRYYRTLATFTWRHVYLGRAFAWRDGFLWFGRLPEWSIPPRSVR